MSEQQRRRRDPWKLPGEGTGVYGVDPLVFLKPGDNAEVDTLLEELRTDCDEGDPFFVDYRKRGRKLRATGNRGEGGAREKGMKRRGGVSPRWLGYATLAIVGPVVMLLLVMVLSSRRPVSPEAPREVVEGGAARREALPSVPSAATAAPSDGSAKAMGGAPIPTPSSAERAASLSAAEPSSAERAASLSAAEPSSAPSSRAAVVRPKPSAAIEDPDPYAVEPATPKSIAPPGPPELPKAAPPEAREGLEAPESRSGSAVEKPEAEF